MNGRDELLQMMLSKNITPEEFNFDKLSAPPVQYFLSPTEIGDLVYLANSVKYSAKIEFKYKEIDRILKARGFELLGRGTNRVVYKYLENNQICLKVAVDHVGSTDNPREFINQQYLKPFVSKIFNVDPSGTIAVAERVHPISSREEFMNYIDGIYDLVTRWFIGKYVVNDIGTKYFMNWGIRYSTGIPVLLDYPYFYLLDIRKAKCMSELEDGSICCGDIDYDDGYNILTCTKCGKNYKAIELAKGNLSNIEHSIVSGGGNNMRAVVSIRKGNEVNKVTINPETKKLEEQYSYAAKVSTKVIKEVIDQKAVEESERKANHESPSSNIMGSKMPKVNVQARKNPVSIVINEENKSENRSKNNNYKTDSKFIKNDGKKSNHKKKNKVRINISQTNEVVVDELDPRIGYSKASVKDSNPKKEMTKKIEKATKEEKKDIVVEETVEVKEEVEVTSAEDETSVVNEEGVHVEDESHEEDEINKNDIATEEITSEIVSDEIIEEAADNLQEAIIEAVEEATEEEINEDSDQVSEEDTEEVVEETVEESSDESTEEIEEATEETEEDAEEPVEDEEEMEAMLKVEEEVRKERETMKKKGSKSFDPDFYNGKTTTSRRKPKTTKENEDE